jgi:putative endonuclease
MNTRSYYVYVLTNTYNTVFYTGVTSDLIKRVYEHQNKLVEGFTKKYNLWKLIYYEEYDEIQLALNREKQVKKLRREKKIRLIEKDNPLLKELTL